MKSKLFCMILTVIIAITNCGCASKNVDSNEIIEQKNNELEILENTTKEDKNAFSKSTAKNDTDLGLKNIKIDYAQGELTEEQKQVIKYFSSDYMFVNSIEALQRYNNIFEDALIESYVNVAKILSYEENAYEILVYMVENSNEYYWGDYMQDSRYMVIKGETENGRFIQGDDLKIKGRFVGVQNVNVDGTSLNIPVIDVHEGYLMEDDDPYSFYPSRFSMEEVKEIAKCIFGEDITISNPDPAIDIVDSVYPYYVCTLDNQTNAKFTRYYFAEREGVFREANSNYDYSIEFAADFQHFFLFLYDNELETLTLEYYDNDLNKIWKREFEGTTSANYDFTKNNVYLCANNTLYIINIENGEDTYESNFVGEKMEVRKFNEGILTISSNKADAFVFTDLEGKIVWTQNAVHDITYVDSIQEVEGKLVIKTINNESLEYDEFTGMMIGSNEDYYVIDMENGEIIYQGQVDSTGFHQYS